MSLSSSCSERRCCLALLFSFFTTSAGRFLTSTWPILAPSVRDSKMLSRSSNWINVLEAAKGFRNGIRAIGVPKFAAVDKQAVLETLAHGGGHINLVQG